MYYVLCTSIHRTMYIVLCTCVQDIRGTPYGAPSNEALFLRKIERARVQRVELALLIINCVPRRDLSNEENCNARSPRNLVRYGAGFVVFGGSIDRSICLASARSAFLLTSSQEDDRHSKMQ